MTLFSESGLSGRPADAPQPCSFVPPYLLRAMAERTPQRDLMATGTLALDARLRTRRSAASGQTPPTAAATSGNRAVHTAAHTETLPGEVVRQVGDPVSGDVAVDEAFDYSGEVWDLFADVFGRSSVDGQATPLTVTVHFGSNYDNAFWDGNQLVFGDGDGEVFDRFTKPRDVLAHEFTHGVTQFTAGLNYQGQPGALNESVSDVFASVSKQRVLGQDAASADWLIGEGLFLPGVQARALRSMIEPGTAYDDPRLGRDPQVGSMADFVDTTDDNGGVHLNSGIPNRAFALAARGIGGSSWEVAGPVWYEALTGGEVRADTDFAGFAAATVAAAGRLFADRPNVAEQVGAAWRTVGVLSDPPGPGTTTERPAAGPDVTEADPPAAIEPGAADPQPTPADAGSGSTSAESVTVRRSGGFTGQVKAAELELDSSRRGEELRQLMQQVSVSQVKTGQAGADRFVYTVSCRSWALTVPEADLTPGSAPDRPDRSPRRRRRLSR